mmetsp:Transcript_73556/g.227172  ORF Transcript_73556/g.227172 Transcript_73556/m.227172 type:complete len:248 (-) Transcript_73556:239-982(-)
MSWSRSTELSCQATSSWLFNLSMCSCLSLSRRSSASFSWLARSARASAFRAAWVAEASSFLRASSAAPAPRGLTLPLRASSGATALAWLLTLPLAFSSFGSENCTCGLCFTVGFLLGASSGGLSLGEAASADFSVFLRAVWGTMVVRILPLAFAFTRPSRPAALLSPPLTPATLRSCFHAETEDFQNPKNKRSTLQSVRRVALLPRASCIELYISSATVLKFRKRCEIRIGSASHQGSSSGSRSVRP